MNPDELRQQILAQLLAGQDGQTNGGGAGAFDPSTIDALAQRYGGMGANPGAGMYDTRLSPVTPPADLGGMYNRSPSQGPASLGQGAIADYYNRMTRRPGGY